MNKWLPRGILVTVIVIGGILGYQAITMPVVPVSTAQEKPQELPLTREDLLMLVNEERAKVGVAPLVIDEMLNQSAQWKADDMFNNNYFGHKRPGENTDNGLDYLSVLDLRAGDRCSYISENLTDNIIVNDPKHAINAFVQSKPHYNGMVNEEYHFTGFGISGTKIVQHFCTPS